MVRRPLAAAAVLEGVGHLRHLRVGDPEDIRLPKDKRIDNAHLRRPRSRCVARYEGDHRHPLHLPRRRLLRHRFQGLLGRRAEHCRRIRSHRRLRRDAPPSRQLHQGQNSQG